MGIFLAKKEKKSLNLQPFFCFFFCFTFLQNFTTSAKFHTWKKKRKKKKEKKAAPNPTIGHICEVIWAFY
jgi:hypothetical protein